jgi:endoglucanase
LVSAVAVGGATAQISPKLPAPGEAPAGSPVAKHGQLKVSGNKIVDKNNNPVNLRGMSLFWASASAGGVYYNDDVVGWLAYDWNVSVIRAAITVASGDGGYDGPKGYADGDSVGMISKARTVIDACIRRGVYVLVDWHTHTHNNNTYRTKGVEFFGVISKLYGNYPNVLFEPFNEPLNSASASNVVDYVNPIVTEIRKNSQNIIIVGSPDWSRLPNNVTVSGTNIAYSFHFYTVTHSKGAFSGNITSALNNSKAVVVTEFGTTNADGGQNDKTVNTSGTQEWIDFLEQNNVGWINWSIANLSEASAALTASGTSGGPWSLSTSGTWVRSKITGYNSSVYYPTKTFSINATAGDGGKVEKKVGGSVNNGPYSYGTSVTITAVPNDGWELSSWEGDAYGNNLSLTHKVTGVDLTMNAVFVPLSLVKNGYFTFNITNWTSNNVTLSHDAAASVLVANVTAPGTASSPANVRQGSINRIEAGKKYELSFKAKTASGTRSITPRVTNSNRDRNYLADTAAVQINTEWKTFTIPFSMCYKLSNGTAVTDSTAVVAFQCGAHSDAWTWYLDDVKLNAVGSGTCSSTPVRFAGERSGIRVWSISKVSGALRIRGPIEEGAKASLYDTRGKAIRNAAARDGMAFSVAGVPAGSYFVVVKNRAGADVYRARVSL